MRPRIGITTGTIDRTVQGFTVPASSLSLNYSRAIHAAGGLPLLIPSLPADEADEILSSLDGLLLSGGGDIDPKYWGEEPHPAMNPPDPARDAFELELFRSALARDLPVLGICRGSQVMAVASGGCLWQDIPSQYPGDINHRQTVARHLPFHDVQVTPGSLLARILWPETPESGDLLSLRVNSFHHQAARKCGTLLTAIAASPDGLPEALVAPDATFALGVQWHPEEMADTDPLQQRLFTALVNAANKSGSSPQQYNR